MSPEATQILYEKYPLLFEQHDWPMTRTCMCWGIEVGEGWLDLLTELCETIDRIAKEAGLTGDRYPRASQVKEKFGGLRFYIDGGNDAIYDAICAAERRSEQTCEACGKPGKVISRFGWLMARCPECERAINEKKQPTGQV